MFASLANLLSKITLEEVLISVGLFLVTFCGSLLVVGFILVRIPATFFLDHHPRDWWADKSPWLRWLGIIAKNLLGLLLVVLGVIMSLPGVPGQGILTILIGVVLLDFPGKRRLERKIIGRRKVLAGVNRLRARYGQPPLEVHEHDSPTARKPTTRDDRTRTTAKPVAR
jgi:hypothetical protein